MMMSEVLVAFSLLLTAYLVMWDVSQMAIGFIAGAFLWRHGHRNTRRARALVGDLASLPFVSVIMPAYNEELTVVQSVRALLALDYDCTEIVVVNDGSTDDTLLVLQRTFQLVPAPLAFVQPLVTEPMRGIYRSIRDPALVVVDKENDRCKADAANAGVNAASGVLVLVIDADTVLEPDALSRTAIGEDLDLTARLQRHYRERRQPFRIAFDPHPFGWTQAPEDWQSLQSQRCRWRRGLLQVFWRHRRMIGNARFGVVGLGVLPYMVLFEGVGPLLELGGYVVTTAAACAGFLNWQYYRVLIVASVLFGAATTLLAVLMSDLATQRYMRGRDLTILLAVIVLENCGYRQANAGWG